MADSAREIENLIYAYAELIDGGYLDGVAQLFTHGRICGIENGPPETVFTGTAGVRGMYDMAVRPHDDGTPKTKHLTSNVAVFVDEAHHVRRPARRHQPAPQLVATAAVLDSRSDRPVTGG